MEVGEKTREGEVVNTADIRLMTLTGGPTRKAPAKLEVIDNIVQITEADIDSILRLVKPYKEGSLFVEIGSSTGQLTVVLGEYARYTKSRVITIDNFEGTGSKLEEYYKGNDPKAVLERNLKAFGVEEYVTVIKGDSAESANILKDMSADFVFIDGDHRFTQCYKDIASWFPKVKIGGILAGHDYTGKLYSEKHVEQDTEGGAWIHHGVNKAVSAGFMVVTMLPDTIWCVGKDGK